MNKQQAAELLNVTTRAVERYVERGRLSTRYVRGKTGKIADFDEGELRTLKEEMERTPADVRPAVATQGPTAPDTPDRQTALVRSDQSGLAQLAPQVIDRFDRLLTAMEKSNGHAATPLADKLTLSLKEASELSGLSRSYLVGAVRAGELKAKIIGRGWRVKREDLNSYVKKL